MNNPRKRTRENDMDVFRPETIERLKYAIRHRTEFPPINDWDVSMITNMSGLFHRMYNFNEDISNWDVRNVTDMSEMFLGCHVFNRPLENWNVSNVTNMSSMFAYCFRFNQRLENWDVSNVTNMNSMFAHCTVFNQPLANWNVSNVTDMESMFDNCVVFDQNLSQWQVQPNTNIIRMFRNCPLVIQNQTFPWNVNADMTRYLPQNIREERARERPAQPQLQPPAARRDFAHEVHNAFYKINKPRYIALLSINSPDENYTSSNMQTFIQSLQTRMTEFIESHFEEQLRATLISQLDAIMRKLMGCEQLSNYERIMIGKSVDFAFAQPEAFTKAYIMTFIDDSFNAYDGGSNNMSCARGIKERLVTSMVQAIAFVCPELDTCKNPVYKQLVSVLTLDINNILKKWSEEEMDKQEWRAMSPEQRRDKLVQYISAHFGTVFEEDYAKIQQAVDQIKYVWDVPAGQEMSFGGSRRRPPQHQRRGRRCTKKRALRSHRQHRRCTKKNKTRGCGVRALCVRCRRKTIDRSKLTS